MKAFTLIELLVSTLVLSILVAGIYLILNSGQMAYHTDVGLLELKQPAIHALDVITREIREARGITIIPTADANFDQLIFNTHSKTNVRYYCDNIAGALYDINQDNVVYQLIREYPPLTYKVLTNNISRLKFSQSGNLLTIELQTSKTAVGQRALSFSLRQEVRLRNE
ncbi:MAG: prepilin-type N-terminal cleavage/methylation domain-containing protein [Candidatus Omnitrophota bacterium]|jgi:prepilin-type N-terminal cleavage/methylation domain-containing protein